MTNAYYNDSGNPGNRTKARSIVIREELRLVEVGFDGVEAAVNAKLNAVNPASSGNWVHIGGNVDMTGALTFTAPTPATGDNSNKVATTAFALNVLGAAGALIPPQAGHAGKSLVTDGTSYSWQFVLPSQTGNARKFLSTNGTTASWQTSFGLAAGGISTFAATGAHTGDTRVIDIGDSAGIDVTLQDATGLFNGESFLCSFGSGSTANTQGVSDSAGELLFDNAIKTRVLLLTSNATAAGAWKSWTPSANSSLVTLQPCFVYSPVTNLRGTTNPSPVASIAISGDSVLVASKPTGGVGLELYVVTGTGLAVSLGAVTTTASGDTVSWMKFVAVTGGYALVYVTSGTVEVKVAGITVSGTTVTAGISGTLVSTAVAVSTFFDIACDSLADKVLVAYKQSNTALVAYAVQVTGTTVNPGGTPATLTSTSSASGCTVDVCAISSGNFLVSYGRTDGATPETKTVVVQISGVTCTAFLSVSLVSSWTAPRGFAVSSSLVIVYYGSSARTLSITGGTTLAANAELTGLPNAGTNRPFINQVGSYYVLTGGSSMQAISLSGTTLSAVGSSIAQPGSSLFEKISKPCLSGSYLVVSSASQNGFNLYSVGAGGVALALNMTTVSLTGLTAAINGMEGGLFKLTYGKYIMGIKPAATSSFSTVFIVKYGSIAA